MSLTLEDGALVYRAEALHFTGFVANVSDETCRDVPLVFVLPQGVGLPAHGVVGSDVAGAPRNATSVHLCDSLAAESRIEFHLSFPIVGEVPETAALGSIGVASDRGSLGVGSLRCAVPRRPHLRVTAEVPSSLRSGGVAPATFVIWNVGRSAARGLWLSVVGDEELAVRGGDLDRGVDDAVSSEIAILGSIEVGELREVNVHVHSRGVGRAGTRWVTASVSNEDGDNLWVEAFAVTVETAPSLSVVCDTVYDAMVDEYVDVEALVCSVGNGTASAVAVEVVPRGGVRLDAAAHDATLQPAFTNGRRHLRGELGDLDALSQVRVKFRATIAPSREGDNAGFDVLVSAHDATTVFRHVPVEARYLLGVKDETTRFQALATDCVPGDLLRVKLVIANDGTEALEDARVRLFHSSALAVEGLQDGRSRVVDGTYYAGDVPPGLTHENVLMLRVSALPEGVTPMYVGGVLSAVGAYELPIGSAEVKGRAESYVALEGVIVDGGTVRFVVANRGDAETKRVDIGLICDDGSFVEPGTTRVGEHMLVDDGGHSPLAGSGVVLGAIAPGTSIPVQLNVISERVQYATVTLLVRFAGLTIERRVEVHSLERNLVHTVAGGYTIENAVVAQPAKIEPAAPEAPQPAPVISTTVEPAVEEAPRPAPIIDAPLTQERPSGERQSEAAAAEGSTTERVATEGDAVPHAAEPDAAQILPAPTLAETSGQAHGQLTPPVAAVDTVAIAAMPASGAEGASSVVSVASPAAAQAETEAKPLAPASIENDNEFVEHLEEGLAAGAAGNVNGVPAHAPVAAAAIAPVPDPERVEPPAPLLALPPARIELIPPAIADTRIGVQRTPAELDAERELEAAPAVDSEALKLSASAAVIVDAPALETAPPSVPAIAVVTRQDEPMPPAPAPLIAAVAVVAPEPVAPAAPVQPLIQVPVIAKSLTLVPASLEVTAPWLRGSVSGLAPLISSPARVLAMHALALRFFVPERFLALCPDDRRERIEDTLAGLRKASKADAVRAAAFASAPTFAVTGNWLRLVDSDAVIQASRSLARSVDHVLFTESPATSDDNRLIAEVDVANLGATTRRFEASDAMATTWVFWNLLPTIVLSRPALGEALVAYRNSLEEALYTASPSIESLSMTVAPEVDLALERVRSELISLAAERGVGARM